VAIPTIHMMTSPPDYPDTERRTPRGLLPYLLCWLVALAFACGSPAASGQATTKEPKSKTTSEKKSEASRKPVSKSSSGTRSSSGAKPKSKSSSQSASKTKEKPSAATSAKSQTADKERSKSGTSIETKPADQEKPQDSEEPKPPASSEAAEASPSPSPPSSSADVSSLKPEDLRGFYNNPPEVQQLLTAALELTEQNLHYVYGSADPSRGGMDCSGTIYFLLQKMGVSDVPRSASQQYVWVRRADVFHSVVSTRVDSFELDALRPGHLLFWTGTYSVDVDPPVTHTMIYLGKARSDGRPLMVGASDGRTFRGDKKFGVSVFDFVIPKPDGRNPMSRFIGYAEIPR
jgi:peptidoglycan DL-endopeptidase CwlO